MIKQYTLVNKCLSLLKNCDALEIEELRLEVQLIQVKRLLLLDEVSRQVKDDLDNEAKFEELHHLFDQRCASRDQVPSDLLADKIGTILAALKKLVGSAKAA